MASYELAEPVALIATIRTISTPVDGGWRISFDVPESETAQIMKASELRGRAIKIVLVSQNQSSPE